MIVPFQTALSPQTKVDLAEVYKEGLAYLILRDGFGELENGRTFCIENVPFTIGRARTCNLIVDVTEVSRQHAQIVLEGEQLFIIDLHSANGTYVNDERLIANERRRLRAGDKINLANVCTLELDDPGDTDTMPPIIVSQQGLVLDETTTNVYIDDRLLEPPLSHQQFTLLALLVRNEGKVVMREEIRRKVWGALEQLHVTNQTIDALNNRLRKRLEEVDPEHEYVVTRRGFGLMFRNKPGKKDVHVH